MSTPLPKYSFFNLVGWYALSAPLIAAGIIALGFSLGIPRHPSGSPAEDAFSVAGVVLLSSTAASVLGLFGLIKHSSRGLLWKSVAGMILSCVFLVVLVLIGVWTIDLHC